jgi:hypothetical protein
MDGIVGVDAVLFFVPDVRLAKSWCGDVLGADPYFDEEG